KVINQKKSGPLIARANGINKCCGDYIGFLDSDDFLEKNTLEEISDIVHNYMPDLILFNNKRVSVNEELVSINKHIYSTKEKYTVIEKDRLLRDFLGTSSLNSVGTKIIRREIVFKDKT